MSNPFRSLSIGIALAAVSCFAASATLNGQQAPAQAQLSPVPPYPVSGVIPPSLEQRYVFKDLASGNLILSYPLEMLRPGVSPAGTVEGGRVKQFVSLPNHVDPFIYVHIDRTDAGLLYRYTVKNAGRAKQQIVRWGIDTAATLAFTSAGAEIAESPDMKAPAGWDRSDGDTSAHWASPSRSIEVGQTVGGFNVTSALKPGFVTAFASGSLDASLPVGDLPSAVAKQLDELKPFAMDRQLALTIGPKFAASTPESAIAADFLSGIAILVKHHYLSEASPAIQEVRQQLHTYLQSLSFAPEVSAEQIPHLSLQLSSKPGNDLERQIIEALRVTLEAN